MKIKVQRITKGELTFLKAFYSGWFFYRIVPGGPIVKAANTSTSIADLLVHYKATS